MVDPLQRLASPELDVGSNLIVAAPRGMQLAADVAEFLDQGRLDVHVDIFAFQNERKMATLDFSLNFRQCSHNLLALVVVNNPTCASMCAWAIEPWISCLKSR